MMSIKLPYILPQIVLTMGKKGKNNKPKKEVDVVSQIQKKQQQQTSHNQTPDTPIQKTQAPQQQSQHKEETPTQNQLHTQNITDANLQAMKSQKPSSDIEPNVQTNQEPQPEPLTIDQQPVVEPQPAEPSETKTENEKPQIPQQTNPTQTIEPQKPVEGEQKLEQVEVSENIEVSKSIQQVKSDKADEAKEENKEDEVEEVKSSDEALKEEPTDKKEEEPTDKREEEPTDKKEEEPTDKKEEEPTDKKEEEPTDKKEEEIQGKEQMNILESVENTTQIEAKEEVQGEKEKPEEVKEEPAELAQQKPQQSPIRNQQIQQTKEQVQQINEEQMKKQTQNEEVEEKESEQVREETQEVKEETQEVKEETQEVKEETQEIANQEVNQIPNQQIQEIAPKEVKEVSQAQQLVLQWVGDAGIQAEMQSPKFPQKIQKQSQMEVIQVFESGRQESTNAVLQSEASVRKPAEVDSSNSKTSIQISMGLLDHQLKKHIREEVLIPINQSQQQPIIQLNEDQNQGEANVPDETFEKLQQKAQGHIQTAYESQPFQQISIEQSGQNIQSSERAYISGIKDKSPLKEAPVVEEQGSVKSVSSNKSRLVKIEMFEEKLEENRKLKKKLDEDNPIKKVGICLVATALLSGAAFAATKNKGITAGISVVSFISSYLMQ